MQGAWWQNKQLGVCQSIRQILPGYASMHQNSSKSAASRFPPFQSTISWSGCSASRHAAHHPHTNLNVHLLQTGSLRVPLLQPLHALWGRMTAQVVGRAQCSVHKLWLMQGS